MADTAPTVSMVWCEACQGNGEIVTDWDRYMHSLPDDIGDEAVADCPDCDGRGHFEEPAVPQPDHTPTPEDRVKDAIREWLAAGTMAQVLDDPVRFEREIATPIRAAEQRGYDRRQQEIVNALVEAGGRIVLVKCDAAGVMIERADASDYERGRAAGQAEEREACAAIIYRWPAEQDDVPQDMYALLDRDIAMADAIRARSTSNGEGRSVVTDSTAAGPAPRTGGRGCDGGGRCQTEDADSLDAQRYRWLRSRDLDTIEKGGVFAGLTPENLVLNGEDLDLAIDAALRQDPEAAA